ncbi:hypothetical protein TRFO_12014 [Tritrichomonas foetus]|uniref:Myb-like DNA-binding domain containing protein n=1 Tax=Tritrichomonas foetus TaxID=1144522 RepID=A0A1J4J4W7_9EUKA|nr:hypothetical protein TRFO_12014 [Tritrichomonas foetus]|eukprot:OHS93191.1 hypothetical protein TRFO_12014 [Tritrichomonas foetus]
MNSLYNNVQPFPQTPQNMVCNTSQYCLMNDSCDGSLSKKDHSNEKKGIRHMFSKEEDEKLLELVQKYGENSWKKVSKEMPNRSTRQCHERYRYYLSPHITNGPWTTSEDKLLEEKYNEYGPKWAHIAAFFQSRSDVNVKNRWSAIQRKRRQQTCITISNIPVKIDNKTIKYLTRELFKKNGKLGQEKKKIQKKKNSVQLSCETSQEFSNDLQPSIYNDLSSDKSCDESGFEESLNDIFNEIESFNDFENDVNLYW